MCDCYRLEQLEAGASDGSEFNEWQRRMLAEDEQRQLAAIERRRLHGQLSHEQAILSRQQLSHSNRRKVQVMKEQVRSSYMTYVQNLFSTNHNFYFEIFSHVHIDQLYFLRMCC